MNKLLFSIVRKGRKRGESSAVDLIMKVLKWFFIVYISLLFFGLAMGIDAIVEEEFSGQSTMHLLSKYIIFYFSAELSLRFFLQKLPHGNIRPLLIQNIKGSKIVQFFLASSFLSPFNFLQLVFFVTFTIVQILRGEAALPTLAWSVSMYALCVSLHFVFILMESYAKVFYAVLTVIVTLGIVEYYQWYDLGIYLAPVFIAPFTYPFLSIVYFALPIIAGFFAFRYYSNRLYIESIDSKEGEIVETQNFNWLDRFGYYAIFLKNDIRLLLRNKRAKSTILMSIVFLFYGLLLINLTGEEGSYYLYILIGYIVSGGFMSMFGQFVPSWESAHFKLLTTMNISFKEYLVAKWLLIAITVVVSTIIGAFYIYWSLELYLMIIAMGIFNIGVNSLLVLYTGLFIRSPIDLSVNKNIFGDKKAFNVKVILLSIPQFFIPVVLYGLGSLHSSSLGLILIAAGGCLGLFFRNTIFSKIAAKYEEDKYQLIEAFEKK